MNVMPAETDMDIKMEYSQLITNQPAKSRDNSFSGNIEENSPYNFLTPIPPIYYQTHTPVSLIFTRYVPEEENPYRIAILSPDFSYYHILSRDEFNEIHGSNRPLHQHDTYELVYVLKGELFQRIENSRHKYIENSCCLINRNIRHTEEYSSGFHTLNLSLSREFLSTLIADSKDTFFNIEKKLSDTDLSRFLQDEFQPDTCSEKKYIDFIPQPGVQDAQNYIYTILDKITNIMLNPFKGSSFAIKSYIYFILCCLDDRRYYHTNPISLGSPTENRLFAQITQLMEQTNGRVSRSELSSRLNYSGSYINYIIQKYSGLSTFEYGLSFTMQKATYLLQNENMSVSEIITFLGFSDRTHFYKLFQESYGMTPRAYRMKYRNKS